MKKDASKTYFKTNALSVGYNGNALIRDIDIALERGKLLTLIGPNGSGKSTILKTVSKQLARIRGGAVLDGSDLFSLTPKELAKKQAVVLTERVRPELYTVYEIVSLGRYPYTNMIGALSGEDREIVNRCLELVNIKVLENRDFSTLSDGQKQRVIIARALAQQPELLILDEPTAFLDIKHKLELLSILRTLAREAGTTVIMSLHEIDLALKASDLLLCVSGSNIAAFGTPNEVLKKISFAELYGLDSGSFNASFGSVELDRTIGEPKVFVVAGGGYGIEIYRELQRRRVSFASGILFENDIDAAVAKSLAAHCVLASAFEPVDEARFEEAKRIMLSCESVIDAKTPIGSFNRFNGMLIEIAKEKGLINGSHE